jgi:prefoldin subunit 5
MWYIFFFLYLRMYVVGQVFCRSSAFKLMTSRAERNTFLDFNFSRIVHVGNGRVTTANPALGTRSTAAEPSQNSTGRGNAFLTLFRKETNRPCAVDTDARPWTRPWRWNGGAEQLQTNRRKQRDPALTRVLNGLFALFVVNLKELSHLTSSYATLKGAQAKFVDCIDSTKSICKQNEGKVPPDAFFFRATGWFMQMQGNKLTCWHAGLGSDKQILVPLTNSLYVPGKIGDIEKVVLDIGTGYYVEKVIQTERVFRLWSQSFSLANV